MSADLEVFVLRMAMLAVLLGFVGVVARWLRDGLRFASRQATQPAATAALVVVIPGRTGLEPGDVIPVAGRISIGRADGNGLILADPSVSAHHALLERRDGAWFIRDLGSTNGTLLDGHPVARQPRRLRHGARLRFGSVVLEFRETSSSTVPSAAGSELQTQERKVHDEA